jgi:hypothetical protein
MKTLLGPHYTPPTPEEMQALIRRAHAERADAVRQALAALLPKRHVANRTVDHRPASLPRAA